MKIAIATDDYLTVTGHIGRCNGFIIYDIENNNIINREQINNGFTNHHKGEHHHGTGEHEHSNDHSSLVEGLKGCSNLICTVAGWRVVENLKNNGIEVIFTNEIATDTAALKFAGGTLEVNIDGTCRAH